MKVWRESKALLRAQISSTLKEIPRALATLTNWELQVVSKESAGILTQKGVHEGIMKLEIVFSQKPSVGAGNRLRYLVQQRRSICV
mmetsp:Transcript_22310/g.39549  ORF Transcript_22310/g.39549 Transcript_22310/m.39549 type:complete len:86 (-) Transcript_22310:1153-1410(-)